MSTPSYSDVPSDPKDRGLELEQDLAFHQRTWRMQCAGAILLLLIALAGLVGVFGDGPLSGTVTGDDTGGLRIEHERFARADAPQTMRIRVPATPASAANLDRLALSRDFLDRVRMDAVVPTPVVAEAGPRQVAYLFAGQPAPGETLATFHFTARSSGVLRVRVSAPGIPPLVVRQFVYP
jgi:hypothetical protein